MKRLFNEMHADEATFSDAHSQFREASKLLRSDQREDTLASSEFLADISKLQALLMQSVVTSVSTDITSM